MGGVWGIAEEACGGYCEVLPMLRVGEGLDVGRDEGHEDVPDVLCCVGDDVLDGFTIALVGWGLSRLGSWVGVLEVAAPWVYVSLDGILQVCE